MEKSNGEEEESIPRGGPIYVPNLVSPLTSVHFFQSSLLLALQDLEAEVSSSTNNVDEDEDEDLSCAVDELKIYAEEELVEMAMKGAFKEKEDGEEKTSTHAISLTNEEKADDRGVSTNEDMCIEIPDKRANCLTENGNNERAGKCRPNSKRRKKARELISEEMYAKVEEIARIKKKQDEDKATVRLHSFNPSCRTVEFAAPSSERTERLKPLRAATAGTKVKSSSMHEYVAVVHPEVALTIEVYHNIRRWVKTQEFLVLGRQTLTDLRDKIYCLTDQVMQKADQHDPSGYFLIEDVFCNDLRDPSAIDYSEPIFDWLRNNKDEATKKWECINTGELQQKQKAIIGNSVSQLPHFKAVDMQTTLFCDLKFRLGAGYLYCHQGDCKHTIVVRDMRLVHPEDVQNRVAYPIVIFQLKPRVQKCHVCRIYRATKMTVDDKWAQGNPCYFCDDCYYLLHYKDGSLVYSDFSVYDYQHD